MRVKAQVAEGDDEFSAANAADRVLGLGFNKNSGVMTDEGGDKVSLKALKGYFNNLAAAVTNKKKCLRN